MISRKVIVYMGIGIGATLGAWLLFLCLPMRRIVIENESSLGGETKQKSESDEPIEVSLPRESQETVSVPDVSIPAVSKEGVSQPKSVSEATPLKSDQSPSLLFINRPVSVGFDATTTRKATSIDTIVLHSSYNNQGGDEYSVEKVIGIWESYGVAPHFVIDREGKITQLVSEHDIAYHAGVSQMKDGRKNVNDFSLGVEILNTEDDTYTEAQYTAVKSLVSYLKKTYPIKYVVGHDTIAPGRKTDPWNFDWKKVEIK